MCFPVYSIKTILENPQGHQRDWLACCRYRLTQELNLQCPSPAVAPPAGPSFRNLPRDRSVPSHLPLLFLRGTPGCASTICSYQTFPVTCWLIPADSQGVNPSENLLSPANYSHEHKDGARSDSGTKTWPVVSQMGHDGALMRAQTSTHSQSNP